MIITHDSTAKEWAVWSSDSGEPTPILRITMTGNLAVEAARVIAAMRRLVVDSGAVE